MVVGHLPSQHTRHNLGKLLSTHLVADNFYGCPKELSSALKNRCNHTTCVVNRQSCERRFGQREAESVVPVRLLLRREIIDEIFEVEGNVNKSKWHAAQARMRLHAGLGFENRYRNGSVAYFRSTGQSAKHEVPNSRLRRGINEVCTLLVFSQKGFPKISDAENARAASQYLLEAGWIIEIGFYYIRASLLERFRRFRIRMSRETEHLSLAL